MAIDWARGPIASLMGGGGQRGAPDSAQQPTADPSIWQQGPARYLAGRLGSWISGRFDSSQPIAGQSVADNLLGNDINQTQSRIWGDSATPGTLPQVQGDDMGPSAYSIDPNATSMGPPAGAPMSHQERQDYRDDLGNNGAGRSGNYGVSNFDVGGSPVIFGDNGGDLNQRALFNWRIPGN